MQVGGRLEKHLWNMGTLMGGILEFPIGYCIANDMRNHTPGAADSSASGAVWTAPR